MLKIIKKWKNKIRKKIKKKRKRKRKRKKKKNQVFPNDTDEDNETMKAYGGIIIMCGVLCAI